MLNKLVSGGVQSTGTCDICCLEGHVSDACPNLQGVDVNDVFPNQGQRKYDPYSSTYSEEWMDHPNLRYETRPNPPGFSQPLNHPSAQDKINSLLDQMLKKMDEQHKEIDLKLQHLEMTMKQMQQKQTASDTLVSNLQAQVQPRIPSQPYPNPKDSVNAIALRSGKGLKEPKGSRELEFEKEIELKEPENDQRRESTIVSKHALSKLVPPFPSRLRNNNS